MSWGLLIKFAGSIVSSYRLVLAELSSARHASDKKNYYYYYYCYCYCYCYCYYYYYNSGEGSLGLVCGEPLNGFFVLVVF